MDETDLVSSVLTAVAARQPHSGRPRTEQPIPGNHQRPIADPYVNHWPIPGPYQRFSRIPTGRTDPMLLNDPEYTHLLEQPGPIGDALRAQEIEEALAKLLPTGPCPAWCTETPGHTYSSIGPDEAIREHTKTIHYADHFEAELGQAENCEQGIVTMDEAAVRILADTRISDPSVLRVLARALDRAANELAAAQAVRHVG